MNFADLRTQVWEAIEQVPDENIAELYQLVQTFQQHGAQSRALLLIPLVCLLGFLALTEQPG
jgi:hypothetical protein